MAEAGRFPSAFIYSVVGVAALIVALGVTLSVLDNDWLWLSRSGAVLIIFAMLFEASGAAKRRAKKIISNFEKTGLLKQLVQIQVEQDPVRYGVGEYATQEDIEERIDMECARRNEQFFSGIEKSMLEQLRRVEFLITAIGTFLWAFSDLLN